MYSLLVCLFVCLYPITSNKTAEPIDVNIFFTATHITPGKVYGLSKLDNYVWEKMSTIFMFENPPI